MKKFISAITSLGIAASMISAVVPATAGAADASKGFAIKTYDIAKPSAADAKSTVTIKKNEIPSGGYVIPSALYYKEGVNGSTDSLLVGITTDSKDISFNLYNPTKAYTKSEEEYTINGTKFKTDCYISFAGSYDDLDGYTAAGKPVFGIDSSQTAAGTDNYYIGCSWTNNGKEYKWAGEKSDSYPFYVFDTVIPQNINLGKYTLKFCEYNTDTSGVNYNPSPLVEGEKTRFTTKDGTLKLETMTINVVDDNGSTGTSDPGNTTVSDGNISFTFADKDGKSSIDAKPGDELTIYANINAGGQKVSAMDVQFKLGSGLKLTQIGGKSAALDNSAVSTNEDDCRANFTSVDDQGEPIVPTDGKAAFTLKVKVADNASGDCTIGFSECKVFKDSTNFNYKTSTAPLTVKVTGNGNNQQSSNADINFTFTDKDGKSEISAKPGDEITVYANVTANGKPVAAMDVQFKTDLQITKLGTKATALGGAAASTNEAEGRVNFTSIDDQGEPVIPTDGKPAFTMTVKVPDSASNGQHTIGFSECKVFKDSTSFHYTTAFTPITVNVTGGKDLQYRLGDVNNDGIINAVDASQVLKYYAKISTSGTGDFTDTQKLAADVNKDGIIDAVDAAKILSYYAYASTLKEGSPVSMEDFMAGKK